jgi:hypothetical protein
VPQPVAVRVLGDEALELRGECGMAAKGELDVVAQLERVEALLLEPAGLGAGERLVGEVGQRRTLPERERLADASRRGVRPARLQILLSARDQPLEAVEIELALRHP